MQIDFVGSFFPPEELIHAKEDYHSGHIDRAKYRAAEDRAVTALVERELAEGFEEVTSGETRRNNWKLDFFANFGGIVKDPDNADLYSQWGASTELLHLEGRVSFNPDHHFYHGFAYLERLVHGRATGRQTIPSPAELYMDLMQLPNIREIYPDKEQLIADITDTYSRTLQGFYDIGCRSIQLDDTVIGSLTRDTFTKRIIQSGFDILELHNDILRLFNDSVKDLPRDMTVSAYLSGGDDPVPEWNATPAADNIVPKALSGLKVSRFYLPFGTRRPEAFAVLRYVPLGTRVVLGLVEAHSPFWQPDAEFVAAVTEARKYVPEKRLALSPRTGFKIGSYANRGLTYENQWVKIRGMKELVSRNFS